MTTDQDNIKNNLKIIYIFLFNIKPPLLRRAISASYLIIRDDALEFIDRQVFSWQLRDVWAQPSDHQCVRAGRSVPKFLYELDWLELDDNRHSRYIRRRFTLMRLFYYFDSIVTDIRTGKHGTLRTGRGRDCRSAAIAFMLESFYPDWSRDESRQIDRRKRLQRNFDCGRRWCMLAQYLGCGAELLCSLKMDSIMHGIPSVLARKCWGANLWYLGTIKT